MCSQAAGYVHAVDGWKAAKREHEGEGEILVTLT